MTDRREVPDSEIRAREASLPQEGEHDFEPDVERIHRTLYREPRDPEEGREPAPWWVWTVAAIALFWGGWYLGRYGGLLAPIAHIAFAEYTPYVAEEAAERTAAAAGDPLAAGAEVYAARCRVCHQENGAGVPGVFPPLIGSEWVTGPPELVVLIVLDGLAGPVTVAGETYDGAMPAWRDALTDAEIAAVATYIRQWQTNDAPAVAPERVAELRAATEARTRPWRADELRRAVDAGEFAGGGPAAGTAGPST